MAGARQDDDAAIVRLRRDEGEAQLVPRLEGMEHDRGLPPLTITHLRPPAPLLGARR